MYSYIYMDIFLYIFSHQSSIKSEKGACKSICTAAQLKLGPKLPKEEVQFGKTKVFIRSPETFFCLERLRESHVGGLVGSIQRCWRSFAMRKKFVKLQSSTAKLYSQNKKARRPGSIYRPYLGDYMLDKSNVNASINMFC